MKRAEIVVAGAGAFGTALAQVLASDDTPVTLFARSETAATAMNAARENTARLPGVPLSETLTATVDPAALAAAKLCLIVVPAQQTASFLATHGAALAGTPLVFCAKGVEAGTYRLQSELAPKNTPIAVLSGPGFASEIARGLPTALTIAAQTELAADLQKTLTRPSLRLYRSDDLIGVQLGGALKNVIAIACGIAMGAGLGESARAALLTRGFAEIARLATKMGANPATLQGLSGFGDLALTCGSAKSRNYAHGFAIGAGQTLPEATTEGIATATACLHLAQMHGVEMPINAAVDDVLSGRVEIAAAMTQLLSRPQKSEK